eukprot:TRINITY_DN4929_c0_g1_i1.p1 TRINITY_DN4929_c0_g1~~TRINITY_DN4929_c0_g1_i1.p1  ORF type:complete len:116 (+),score=9.17 TRINITY_DN4929_c0_g1_i1:49-396(+)
MVTGDPCNRNQMMGKRSTRVVASPGGDSTFSLGWGEPEPQKPAKAVATPPQQVPVSTAADAAPVGQAAPVTAPRRTSQSSNAWASNACQNSGNVISDRPTTRIHAPPGGKSSICF